MVINKKINDLIVRNHGIITANQVVALGFSRTVLTKYQQAGLLERIGRGVYTTVDEFSDEMYALSLRSEYLVFSHETSLFLYGMAERAPLQYAVTIPNNRSISSTLRSELQCFYIQPDTFSIGLTKKETYFGHQVPCYDLERTICDLVRSRNRLEAEVVSKALKEYSRRKDRNMFQLFNYAELLHVEKTLHLMMEMIL